MMVVIIWWWRWWECREGWLRYDYLSVVAARSLVDDDVGDYDDHERYLTWVWLPPGASPKMMLSDIFYAAWNYFCQEHLLVFFVLRTFQWFCWQSFCPRFWRKTASPFLWMRSCTIRWVKTNRTCSRFWLATTSPFMSTPLCTIRWKLFTPLWS